MERTYETTRAAASDLSRRETFDLIGSDKVEGTAVYRPNGDRVGHIERVMIGKRDGRVAYAVIGFGGFLGFGEDYFPLPWSSLKYNEEFGGYEADVSEDRLKNAPRYARADEWDWADRASTGRIDDYWSRYPTGGIY